MLVAFRGSLPVRREHSALCRGETINPWPAIDRTFFVGDELDLQLGGSRVETGA